MKPADPDGPLCQVSGGGTGLIAAVLSATCFARSGELGSREGLVCLALGAFFGLVGTALIVGVPAHRRTARGSGAMAVLWLVVTVCTQFGILSATAAILIANTRWPAGAAASAFAANALIPVLLVRAVGRRYGGPWHAQAWVLLGAQAAGAFAFAGSVVLVAIVRGIGGWQAAGALAASLIFVGAFAVQLLLKARGLSPAGLDYNTVFRLLLGTGFVLFYFAARP